MQLTIDDSCVVGDENIGKAFTTMFRTQFGSEQDFRLYFYQSCLLTLNPLLTYDLEASFTPAETKATTFQLCADKAPGLDGFPLLFFQKLWDVVECDIVKLDNELYSHSSNLERINWANIVLIKKYQCPTSTSNF